MGVDGPDNNGLFRVCLTYDDGGTGSHNYAYFAARTDAEKCAAQVRATLMKMYEKPLDSPVGRDKKKASHASLW